MDAKDLLIDAYRVDLEASRNETIESQRDAFTWRAIAKQAIEEIATLTKRCRQLERANTDLRETRRAYQEAA